MPKKNTRIGFWFRCRIWQKGPQRDPKCQIAQFGPEGALQYENAGECFAPLQVSQPSQPTDQASHPAASQPEGPTSSKWKSWVYQVHEFLHRFACQTFPRFEKMPTSAICDQSASNSTSFTSANTLHLLLNASKGIFSTHLNKFSTYWKSLTTKLTFQKAWCDYFEDSVHDSTAFWLASQARFSHEACIFFFFKASSFVSLHHV